MCDICLLSQPGWHFEVNQANQVHLVITTVKLMIFVTGSWDIWDGSGGDKLEGCVKIGHLRDSSWRIKSQCQPQKHPEGQGENDALRNVAPLTEHLLCMPTSNLHGELHSCLMSEEGFVKPLVVSLLEKVLSGRPVNLSGITSLQPWNHLIFLICCLVWVAFTEQDSADAKTDEEAEEDERNIADLLVDQLEFADVIILNKTDLVPRDRLHSLEAFLHVLNPGAKLMSARESKAPPFAPFSTIPVVSSHRV